jgi:hypothetical protein
VFGLGRRLIACAIDGLATVLFDPDDEYFIPAAKATDLAPIRFVAPSPSEGDADYEKNPNYVVDTTDTKCCGPTAWKGE